MAFDPEPWHELFVMSGGAAAALAGLIFVAVSLNHEHILQAAVLPPLAAQTLAVLVSLVLFCLVGLTPGQDQKAVGAEISALGALLSLFVVRSTLLTPSTNLTRWWRMSRLALSLAVSLPAVVAGVSILADTGGGLYWLLVEIGTGFVVAAYYAWILLIEIRR